jgi:tRNA dimethylallyltransferase
VSEVAQILARELDGEIVSVDSMQVYRGLDIGTAKPFAGERRRVPHHLIDVAGLDENFDAARFARMAHAAVEEIRGGNRVPILCGGTGLYFKAFLEGVGEAPPADAALREELQGTPLTVLLEELKRSDPVTYEKIDRSNPRRVIRAVEVIRLTGKPFSQQRVVWGGEAGSSVRNANRFFGIGRSVEDLRRRIDARVDAMFARGLVAETEQMLKLGLSGNKTAIQAIGYRQVVEHLRGERPLAETIEIVKIRTRQYAKRQMTWFRKHAEVTWIHAGPDSTADEIGLKIRDEFMRQTAG